MATDQEIRDAGFKYIPQQKYLQNPFELPENQEPVVDEGIVNTNAFANSGGGGDNNIGGNLFGYGTAVQPGDKSVITSGPFAGQSGYYNSPNYRGGLPGNIQQKGPGRFFQYDNSGKFYKDETLQPKKELPSWMKAAMAFAPGGTFLADKIENKMNPGYTGITQQQIDEDYGGGGGSYGIAGLSDTQKQYYDALAGQRFLYDGPGGMKTLDGKNFSRVDEDTINDYFQGKIDKYGSIEEYEKYIAQDPKRRKNLGLILKQYKTLQGINDFNYRDNLRDIGASNIDEATFAGQGGDKAAQQQIAQQQQNRIDRAYREDTGPGPGSYGPGGGSGIQRDSSGRETGYNDPFDPGGGEKDGGFIDGTNRRPFNKGGRIGFQGGGSDASSDDFGTSTNTPGPGDTGGEGGTNPSDGSDTQFGGGNNGGENNNPPVTMVNNKPVDISTVTKSIGDYKIPYGLEALISDKGRLQAVLNADNVLNKNLGLDFTYDQGPYQIGFNADMEGNKNLGLSYNKGNLSAYANTNFNDPSVGFKYSRAFAYGGLASIL